MEKEANNQMAIYVTFDEGVGAFRFPNIDVGQAFQIAQIHIICEQV